ncbi:hypothetical protein WR25_20306 [Diploscapter pachys]|uniref:TRAF-type domain-containing protein n=1 Tax=Diploscapter pachys TaxID=2018661 RepID=A0A2A2LQ15_9BILA|nr:hypothetical protein WR25_20306 [Diploscapter pachys]
MKAQCDHYYCRSCVTDDMKCIICEQPIDKEKLVYDKKVHRAIQALTVLCSNQELGCEWADQLKVLPNHVKQCQYKSERCMNCGGRIPALTYQDHIKICRLSVQKCEYCQSTIRATLLEKHLKTCPQVIISCPFQCGAKDKTRAEIDAHRTTCPNAAESCPFMAMGCNFKGNKEAVQKHLSAEPVKHMIYLCDEMTELKSIYSLMHYEMSCIEPKHDELMRKANLLQGELQLTSIFPDHDL